MHAAMYNTCIIHIQILEKYTEGNKREGKSAVSFYVPILRISTSLNIHGNAIKYHFGNATLRLILHYNLYTLIRIKRI